MAPLLPVNRTFSGTTVTIGLALGTAGDPDARLRLDGGVVYARGLVVTVSTELVVPGMVTSGAGQPRTRG